mmetsp:Transcript_5828/g.8942  ORF Transcript_5828/g.8942 Transcript_5828/m.8942 type:complete len:318 (+) Transcript_5828:86-1039(+)
MKVVVLGAAGGIGQALSLLLKSQLPSGSELSLFDVAPVVLGVAADLSHIPTNVKVRGFTKDNLSGALNGCDIALIPAGVPRKPGMDRSDLFNTNAGIVQSLVEAIADSCPDAFIGIITNPMNTTVAIAAETLKSKGVYNKNKLFGVTTLDVIRAETFVAELKGIDVESIHVPVIGGHSGKTILPLLSRVNGVELSSEEIVSLTERIQNAGTEVVEAKAGNGGATLSMGQAAARFCISLVRAIQGKKNVIEYTYIENDSSSSDTEFFSLPVRLGPGGVEEILPYGNLSDFEEQLKANMVESLRSDIKLGQDFIKRSKI